MSGIQEGAAERQVQVRFVTKQAKYAVTDTPINVPVSLRRYALSEIVNHLLDTESPVPFDFVLDGQFMRSTLEKHIAEKGLSAEVVLELEYFEALPPPAPLNSFKQDDWISATHANVEGLILTGAYDNSLSIWSISNGECMTSSRTHTAPVKAVRWVPDNNKMCVSASQDCTLMAWDVSESGKSVSPKYVFKGHSASVEGVAISADADKFVSASFDHTVKLWSLSGTNGDVEEEAEPEAKKQKRGKRGEKEVAKRVVPQAPVGTLTGHTNAVTSVVWGDGSTVYSGSWDHTIRQWDLNSGINAHTMGGQKAISAVAWSPVGKLLASTGADRTVRIWDPRERDGPVVKLSLSSHTEMTSCVAWSPSNGNRLVSGAYDGTVKVWDIRSTIPLHTLTGHEDKVLCVDWTLPEYVVSGSADTKLVIHNVKTRLEGA